CVSLKFEAKRGVPGDFAEFARAHIILSRSYKNGGKVCGRNGHDATGAAFGEEGVLGGRGVVGRNRSGGTLLSKNTFGEGAGEAAIGNVVRGLNGARGSERDEAIDEAFFGGEIDRGRFARDYAYNGFRIFRRRKFALVAE